MGLDLRFLPFDCDRGDLCFSHTVLSCERRSALFEALWALPTQSVPAGFTSLSSCDDAYEESHYGPTMHDPYGAPVGYVTVEALVAYGTHEGVQDNALNRAIWAYLGALAPRTKVALFWH